MKYFIKIATNKKLLIKELAGLLVKNKDASHKLSKSMFHTPSGVTQKDFFMSPDYKIMVDDIMDRSTRMDWIKRNHLNKKDISLAYDMSKFTAGTQPIGRSLAFDHFTQPHTIGNMPSPYNAEYIGRGMQLFSRPPAKRGLV